MRYLDHYICRHIYYLGDNLDYHHNHNRHHHHNYISSISAQNYELLLRNTI